MTDITLSPEMQAELHSQVCIETFREMLKAVEAGDARIVESECTAPKVSDAEFQLNFMFLIRPVVRQ